MKPNLLTYPDQHRNASRTSVPGGGWSRLGLLLVAGLLTLNSLACQSAPAPTLIPTASSTATSTATTTPTAPATPTLAPSAVPTLTGESVSSPTPTAGEPGAGSFTLTSFPQTELKWGATVSVTIKTSPGAVCVLSYQTPDGRQSTANGLGSQSADEAGRCVWIWKISAGTKPGTGQVFIEVDGQGEKYPITIK